MPPPQLVVSNALLNRVGKAQSARGCNQVWFHLETVYQICRTLSSMPMHGKTTTPNAFSIAYFSMTERRPIP